MKLRKVALCILMGLLLIPMSNTIVHATENNVTESTLNEEVNYKQSDVKLLAGLIYCEAGHEPYAGKLAVGIIVMNRVNSQRYPDTVKGVVYQKRQFSPVHTGKLRRVLNEYDKGHFTSTDEKECIRAAKEALSGTKRITYRNKTKNMQRYYYFNTVLKHARYSIANHKFK